MDAASPTAEPQRSFGGATATFLVVASMVGTGVYTTTGFLIRDVGSNAAVLLTWVVGGFAAGVGALCYAELAAAIPVNGGEYAFLRRIYHPVVGFLAGWVSFLVGFSAPAAAAAIAFGDYLHAIAPAAPARPAAVGLLVALTGINAWRVGASSAFQNAVTGLKIVLIVAFIVAGLAYADLGRVIEPGRQDTLSAVVSAPFAVGVVYVFYAYSGWNAATYIAGEVDRPQRVLPIALIVGTTLVAVLYLALNMVFLGAAPSSALSGVLEVGYVAADELFGRTVATMVSGLICLGLVTTIGAIMMAGPRVYEAMGRDYGRLAFLTRKKDKAGPRVAIALQGIAALAMTIGSSFDTLLAYMGITLSISSGLTVIGVIVLRRRAPDLERPYRTWGYPLTPIVFALVVGWVVAHTLWVRPVAAVAAIATLVVGAVVYSAVRGSAHGQQVLPKKASH